MRHNAAAMMHLVVAEIPAQVGQRDEYLWGESDGVALALVAHG